MSFLWWVGKTGEVGRGAPSLVVVALAKLFLFFSCENSALQNALVSNYCWATNIIARARCTYVEGNMGGAKKGGGGGRTAGDGGRAALALAAAATAAVAAALARRVRRKSRRGKVHATQWKSWQATTVAQHLRTSLGRKGLDVVAPLKLQWYNAIAPESAKIAPGGTEGGNCLVVLVGNSRELWPKFCKAHDTDPGIADAEDPLDTYVAREVERAVQGAPTAAAAARVFYAHEIKPGRLVAIQRMAHVAGLCKLHPVGPATA
jgi:hypothetical protein